MTVQERVFTKDNPVTGECMASVPCLDASAVDKAVQEAKAAQLVLSVSPLKRRAACLNWIADALSQRLEAVAGLISREVGKPQQEALLSEGLSAISAFRYVARYGPGYLRPQNRWSLRDVLLGQLHQLRYAPLGVIGVITPWNYPLGTPASTLAAAIMCGNAVVWKPSELTTETAYWLQGLIKEGLSRFALPEKAIQLVSGDGQTGKYLVEHPDVTHLVFTGSTAVGRQIQVAMAQRGARCTLELGGSDPLIVLPDAVPQLDGVASAILWGRFANAGQTCAAVKRVLVPQALLVPLQALLQAKIGALRVGSPLQPETQLGPLISERQQRQVLDQVERAEGHGDTLWYWPGEAAVSSAQCLPSHGAFVRPALAVVKDTTSPLWQEEVFGPVLALLPYQNVSEAITLANEGPYGLGASVFGPYKQAKAVALQLQAGQVGINEIPMSHYAYPQLPWTGWKQSGPGVRNGEAGLLELTRQQVLGLHWPSYLGQLIKAPYYFGKPAASSKGNGLTAHVVGLMGQLRLLPALAPSVSRWLWQHRPSTRL